MPRNSQVTNLILDYYLVLTWIFFFKFVCSVKNRIDFGNDVSSRNKTSHANVDAKKYFQSSVSKMATGDVLFFKMHAQNSCFVLWDCKMTGALIANIKRRVEDFFRNCDRRMAGSRWSLSQVMGVVQSYCSLEQVMLVFITSGSIYQRLFACPDMKNPPYWQSVQHGSRTQQSSLGECFI